MGEMSAEDKIERLRQMFSRTIEWYQSVLETGEPDSSYLYDVTLDRFCDDVNRGDIQELIALLLHA